MDVNPSYKPHIVADACSLPLREEIFDLVYFTDVIERLPSGHEHFAIQEIVRVLVSGGKVIITTPNATAFYTKFDILEILRKHYKHYRLEDLTKLLRSYGFEVEVAFTFGGSLTFIKNLVHLFSYPLELMHSINLPLLDSWGKVNIIV